MRDIKFRAWNSILNEYRKLDMNSGKQNLGMGFEVMGGINSNITTIYRSVGDVIEQYTGLKDKNGVEIYEGDVLWTGVDYVYISFKSGAFVVISGIEDEVVLSEYPIDEWTISGNIHENADLLEEQ